MTKIRYLYGIDKKGRAVANATLKDGYAIVETPPLGKNSPLKCHAWNVAEFMKSAFETETHTVAPMSESSPGHFFAPVDCGGLSPREHAHYTEDDVLIQYKKETMLKKAIPAMLKWVSKIYELPKPKIAELRATQPDVANSAWHTSGPPTEPCLWLEIPLHGSSPAFVKRMLIDPPRCPVLDKHKLSQYLKTVGDSLRSGERGTQSKAGGYLGDTHDILTIFAYSHATPVQWVSDAKFWRYSIAFQWRLWEDVPSGKLVPAALDYAYNGKWLLRLPQRPYGELVKDWQRQHFILTADEQCSNVVSFFAFIMIQICCCVCFCNDYNMPSH
jgi:hypothetical protein